MYKDTELAYLAGLIDGEGTIYIGNHSKNPKNGIPYYQTLLKVTSTNKIVIDWLKDKFGGWISTYTPKQTPLNSRRQPYSWNITGSEMENLFSLTLQFLIIKKEECKIMLKMRETYNRKCSVKGKQGIQSIPKEIIDLRQHYFLELRKLHCRNYNNKK